MEKKPSKYWIVAGTILTSISSIIIRFSQAPALVISAYRMLFTCLLLFLPIMINNRYEFKSISKKNFIMCIFSGIFLAFHYATWISSIHMTTIANSTVLVACNPIFVAIGNYFILKEKFSYKMIAGIVIALLGTLIIAMGSTGGEVNSMMLGNILAFLGAVFVAGYFVIGGIVRKNIGAGVYVFIVYLVSTIILFLMCFVTGTPIYPYPAREFLLFIALAFFCSTLGHTIYNYLVKYVSSSLISVSTLSEPIFASILAIFFFKEIPSLHTLVGGIIILLGIFYYLISQNNTIETKKSEELNELRN